MFVSAPPRTPALRRVVDFLWYHEDPEASGLERVLPKAVPQLLVNLAEPATPDPAGHGLAQRLPSGTAVLDGLGTAPRIVDRIDQRAVAGAVLRTGACAAFLPGPVNGFGPGPIDLADPWGRDGATLAERLADGGSTDAKLAALETALADRLRPTSDPRMLHAAAGLDAGRTIVETAGLVGLSPRRFAAVFTGVHGVPPKRFARLRRFHRAVQALSAGDTGIAAIAAGTGYHDQPHLAHEFRRFAGVSPSRYRRLRIAVNHLRLDDRFLQAIAAGLAACSLPWTVRTPSPACTHGWSWTTPRPRSTSTSRRSAPSNSSGTPSRTGRSCTPRFGSAPRTSR